METDKKTSIFNQRHLHRTAMISNSPFAICEQPKNNNKINDSKSICNGPISNNVCSLSKPHLVATHRIFAHSFGCSHTHTRTYTRLHTSKRTHAQRSLSVNYWPSYYYICYWILHTNNNHKHYTISTTVIVINLKTISYRNGHAMPLPPVAPVPSMPVPMVGQLRSNGKRYITVTGHVCECVCLYVCVCVWMYVCCHLC